MFPYQNWKQFLYAAIDPGAGGGPAGVAPGAQPVAPAPTPQPQGQGQPGQQGQGDGFRSTFFQGVPDDQWALIEPHVGRMNQHFTQLQQRYAPFSSYTPEAVQGLARFAESFEADPAGQWITLARALQQQGRLDPDLDVDHLESLLSGQQQQQKPQVPEGLNPQDPRDALIMQLQQKLDEVDGWRQQTQQERTQRVEDVALNKNLDWMKEQLKAGGIDESLLTRNRLIAAFVGHGGNAQAAVQDQLDYRTALMGGVVPDPAQVKKQTTLDLPNGAPKLPAERRAKAGANRRGMFGGDVSVAAEQYLARQS
jgi:hypothetical protein